MTVVQVNVDECKLIAMLVTDGGISPHGHYSWDVYSRNKSDVLNELFRETVHDLFGTRPSISRRLDGTTQQRIRSKSIGEQLLRRTNSLRTRSCSSYPACGKFRERRNPCIQCIQDDLQGVKYPHLIFPKEIEEDERLTKLFLKVAYSCDGGVSLSLAKNGVRSWLIRKVFIDSVNPSVREYYQRLLSRLRFRSRSYGSQVRLQDREMLEKFCAEIGFVDGTRVTEDSRRWVDRTKNSLLALLLCSYKDPSVVISYLTRA